MSTDTVVVRLSKVTASEPKLSHYSPIQPHRPASPALLLLLEHLVWHLIFVQILILILIILFVQILILILLV